MRISPACWLCAVFALAAGVQTASAQGVPVRNIQLTGAGDIEDASAVNRAISAMVKDVASCSPATQSSPSCACGFKDDLKKLKAAYDAAVAKHPAWKDEGNVVAYTEKTDRKSVTLSFPGVKRQLDVCAGL
jgi:hypothetical protein